MTQAEHILTNIDEKFKGRRGFIRQLGLASAGVGAFLAKAQAQATITDADIVQFALNLEYLEAEFYTVARLGKTIDQMGVGITGSGTAGATTGGQKVTFIEGSTLALATDQIGADERQHVTFLRTTLTSLGVTPISKPAINLNALGSGFESQEAYINLARSFEDVGVSAYAGAAPLIKNATILGAAARILAVEAYHAGILRLHAALYQAPTKPVDALDQAPPPTGTRFVPVDSNALALIRTPGQVLNIVYGGAVNATSGGFFPTGVNGAINGSSAPATAGS